VNTDPIRERLRDDNEALGPERLAIEQAILDALAAVDDTDDPLEVAISICDEFCCWADWLKESLMELRGAGANVMDEGLVKVG
jgi:hypothetical protein